MHPTPKTRKTELDGAVLQVLVARGRRLRAEAFRAALATAVRAVGRLARALGAGVFALARRYRAWWQRRLAIAELLALDDRSLRDIGLSRGDVARVVRQLRQGVPVEEAAARAEVLRLPKPRAEPVRLGKLAA
ncbi:MAG: DUF1127 domain-containing protein [Kiloniellales bacterium]|nr:DUF1127 domain-containing protein [Kiloniellales bacterium]